MGDCYVAVCGLPNPNPQHATVMARFAKDCLQKSEQLTKALETTLGPDTGDLTVRIGLHSGQVTAGESRNVTWTQLAYTWHSTIYCAFAKVC